MHKDDIFLIEERLKVFEMNTGCDLLLVVAKNSDQYAVAPWRFSVFSSCIALYIFSLYSNFSLPYYYPISFSLLLFLTYFIGKISFVKKIFVKDEEIDQECHEYAIKNFYQLGISKIAHKVTAMIMVSLWEKRISVLVDSTLKEKISQEELDELVDMMKIHFKKNDYRNGFIASIDSLEKKILKDFGGKVTELNVRELSDKVHFI